MPDLNIAEDVRKEIAAFGTDLKAANDNTKRELEQMRAVIDENGKKVDAVADERINKFATSIEAKTDSIEKGLKAISETVDKLEAAGKRPGAVDSAQWANTDEGKRIKAAFDWHKAKLSNEGKLGVNTKIEPDQEGYEAYAAAFAPYMRARTEGALPTNFQAALQTGSDPDGGYLVPKTVSDRIISRIFETSNMRAFATVETISGKELEIPRDEGEFGTGGWVGEQTAPSETTTSQLGLSKIFAFEMFAEPRVTQNMLEDAGIDIEAWVANKVGNKFARVEATAFFTGDGVHMPRGLLTYGNWATSSADGHLENGKLEQIKSGAATAIAADPLYDLVYSLKDFYTTNARFMMNRLTVRDVLKLKDGQGRYLWQMGDIRGGQPSTLLDYEVVRAADMPVAAASALPIAFGDFREAYTIVDRLGITLLRDNLTAKPFVKFYNRRRVGGDVVNFEAVKLMLCST